MRVQSKIKSVLFIVVGVMLLTSCFNEKKITYFQKGANQTDTIDVAKAYIPKVQPSDILSIYVNSLSPEASTFFNPYISTAAPSSGDSGGSGLTETASPGFLVDASGNINLPLIGVVPVAGLTTIEASEKIKKQLEIYLKEPTVIVRFMNFKISVLGEVNKPGVYVVPNERVTLPELITIAGDLTTYAKRNEIEIIRDVNGKKQFGLIDLTTRDVFSSPYYYLHANDIVYVRSGKAKAAQSEVWLRVAPIAISVVTLLVVIFSKI